MFPANLTEKGDRASSTLSEADQAVCNANISALLKRLSEAEDLLNFAVSRWNYQDIWQHILRR